ncbi:MAG: GlmU family protein [Bacteroidia bacterium]|nr:GlmU family protein [Bacteroidia bacterium]
MNIIFFDTEGHTNLLPLTYTRPVAKLRIGILTIEEKWLTHLVAENFSYLTQGYLQKKYPIITEEVNWLINATFCPNTQLVQQIKELEIGQAIMYKDKLAACCLRNNELSENLSELTFTKIFSTSPGTILNRTPDLFLFNDVELKNDFEILTKNKVSQSLSKTNTIIGNPDLIFLEEGAQCEAAILNTKSGPIYLGKNSEVMEGSAIRGAFALCENAQLKLNTKIYGATTVGPHCKVGGEINNSVILGYSNKAHDGFLGNSVLGEWCNLGADTNNSNLKNNYAEVKLWHYEHHHLQGTGLQFCGLIMGDHSKSGINTMFNTGTTVGVCSNIFGGNFPPAYIPSFAWGGSEKLEPFRIEKAFEIAQRVMERRNITLTETDKAILQKVLELNGMSA